MGHKFMREIRRENKKTNDANRIVKKENNMGDNKENRERGGFKSQTKDFKSA